MTESVFPEFGFTDEERNVPDEISPTQADPRDRKKYYLEVTPTRVALISVARLMFDMVTKMEFSGAEHLPKHGPAVLAANHLTNFDPFLVQFASPRPLFFMAKAELHKNKLMDILLRQLGSFPVNRGAKDEWAMRHALKILQHGQVLGIFPEGTRSKTGGLRAAKTGAARLALEIGCPIVPMALDGTHKMLKGSLQRTQVHARIGAPIQPVPEESPLALTDRVMFALAGMLPVELRGVYSQHPQGF